MNVVVFDLETTGLDVAKDEIIQIGAVCMDMDLPDYKGTFEVKIRPTLAGKAGLSRMQEEGFKNCYDEVVWNKEGISAPLAMQRFTAWVGRFKDQTRISKAGKKYQVVRGCGYNAAKFDHPFIMNWCRHYSTFLPMDMRCWDTLQFALFIFEKRGIDPVDYKLETIAKMLEIDLTNAHDALADVIATAEVTRKLFSMV